MKKYLLLIASVLMLASCSAPKYAYYFDHYDYNSGKKKAESPETRIAQQLLTTPDMSPLKIDERAVLAGAEKRLIHVETSPAMPADATALEKKYSAMSKHEKKAFRKELKSEVKKFIKEKKSGESIKAIKDNKAMDHDLKMALIFGIVGITLSLFGGVNSLFWILGVIATVIAIVFLIKWIAEQ